jgi:DNA-binding transcriptional LysR family regulator
MCPKTLAAFDLNLRHLRALDAIAVRGSMSAAAQAVSLSQPALTQGLSKLERQLGVTLFDRRSDGVTPTAAGRVFAERSRRAFAHLAVAGRAITRGPSRGFARPEHLMTATQLRAFLSLADASSFVAAAQATGLSQPALHGAVRALEQVCAVPLVERRGRGVTLTRAGRSLARGIRLARAEIVAGLEEVQPEATSDGRRITVGAMPFSRALLLPNAIARLIRAEANVTIDVVEGSWRELVEPLQDGIIDLMIGALRPEVPPDLQQIPLVEDHLVVAGRRGHPLAAIEAPRLDQLACYPWVVGRPGAPLRMHWEALFGGGPLPPHPVECGSLITIRGILRESDLLALLSIDQLASEAEAGRLVQIGPSLTDRVRTIGITTRADWRPTELQQRFVELVGPNENAPSIQEIG